MRVIAYCRIIADPTTLNPEDNRHIFFPGNLNEIVLNRSKFNFHTDPLRSKKSVSSSNLHKKPAGKFTDSNSIHVVITNCVSCLLSLRF